MSDEPERRPVPPRPVPRPEGLNAEFYDRCREEELCFQRCEDCGAWRHPPCYLCPRCGSDRWSWKPSSGRGRLFTWTVTHQAMHPAFAQEVPYTVAVVELEEGPRLVGRLRDVPPERLEIDLPVEVEFEEVAPGIKMPTFRSRRS